MGELRPSGTSLARGAARAATVAGTAAESIAEAMERVHRQISPSMGDMCIAMEKRRARVQAVRYWASVLRQGAADLEKLADRMETRQ